MISLRQHIRKILLESLNESKKAKSKFQKLEDNKIGEEFKQLLELFMKASGRRGKGHK